MCRFLISVHSLYCRLSEMVILLRGTLAWQTFACKDPFHELRDSSSPLIRWTPFSAFQIHGQHSLCTSFQPANA
jgi:hypothetical protein